MPSRTTPHRLLAATILAAALSGCGTSAPDDGDIANEPAVDGREVAVLDNTFEPPHLRVEAGATVRWRWRGGNPHDVAGDGFGSDVQTAGTFSRTFEEAGQYEYICNVHDGMRGIVTVDAA